MRTSQLRLLPGFSCSFVLVLATISPFAIAQTTAPSEWTWMGGSSALGGFNVYLPGSYGTLGTPSPGNIPGGRNRSSSWIDRSGDFWLFGGQNAEAGSYDDLWEFNPSINEWTWVSGGSSDLQSGVYGTLGVPAAGNVPGSRFGATSWIDASGNLWLFGGSGTDSQGFIGYLNDLLRFNPSKAQWTWMGGGSTLPTVWGGNPGAYGALGEPAAANVPGGRVAAAAWSDGSGNFWLFGGAGFDQHGSYGLLNDLWRYDPSSNEWAWMSGSSTIEQPGVYGTLGTPAPANVPGARSDSMSWIDALGNFWLFGGEGNDANGSGGVLNDLWEFSPSANEWAWMAGSSTVSSKRDQPGVYGTMGEPGAGNTPGSRSDGFAWADPSGYLWLLGGQGSDAVDNIGNLNDLWKFNPFSNPVEWIWIGGSSTVPDNSGASGQPGVYGSLGIPEAENIPGGRAYYGANWTDSSGDLWLFGGFGDDSDGNEGDLNDLWVYQPAATASVAPEFSVAVSPTALAAAAGNSATTTVSITSENGFNSAVSFACSRLPAGASCSFSPATVTPPGTTSTTLTLNTPATSALLQRRSNPLLPGSALAAVLWCLGFKRRRRGPRLLLLAGLVGLILLSACGGGATTGGGSQPVTSTVTLTATSGSLSHSTSFSLTIN